MKGAAKDATGAVLGDERLEREGERENAEGRTRQAQNDAIGGGSRPRPSVSTWSNKHLVTGLYDTPDAAGKAYQDLTSRHGYKADDISVVMSDDTRKRHFGDVKPGRSSRKAPRQPRARVLVVGLVSESAQRSVHWSRRRPRSRFQVWASSSRVRLRGPSPVPAQAVPQGRSSAR